MLNLTKKYVIGTHIMWFEIEMYSDFVDGILNLLDGVEMTSKENVTIDLCFNMSEQLESIDRAKIQPEELLQKFNHRIFYYV